MELLFAVIVGVLLAAGVYLLLAHTITRLVLGLSFIGYAANLAILTVGGLKDASPPLLHLSGPYQDPLPQALILTAIVIGFATTALVLTVAIRAYQVAGHDDVTQFGDNLARLPELPEDQTADPAHLSPEVWPDLPLERAR